MPYYVILLFIAVAARATAYIPSRKVDPLLTDILLEYINRVGNDLAADTAYSEMEYPGSIDLANGFDQDKEIPLDLPIDYDTMDGFNPNPSIRDQEYLRHSTIWSHQNLNNNFKGNDRHMVPMMDAIKNVKSEKPENTLPAYCTPPNPCPVGYTSKDHCLEEFENTAAFSRKYQSAQDCMCDTEHMLDCPNDSPNDNGLPGMRLTNSDFDQIVEQFQEENPFFHGEKLPIAAKKGINIGF